MRLPVLGSGDAFGNGVRFQTCFALRDDDRAVLIDWGATSLTAMKRADMDPRDVTAVVVSHLHGDHFGGLPFLVLDAQFRRRGRLRGYEVDHASGAPPLAVTVRFGGATVGYSGDTAWVPNVLRASAGADIFLVVA